MDGSVEITLTDDSSTKMTAVGFHANEVYDGANNVCSSIFPTSLLFPQADRDNLLVYCDR